MHIRFWLKEKKLMRSFVSLAAVAVLCSAALVSFFLLRDSSLAWFFENTRAQGDGIRVETGTDQLRFEPVITVLPSVGDTVYDPIRYFRHTDGGYYRAVAVAEGETEGLKSAGVYEGVSYVFSEDADGALIPIQLTGLFPGETLTVTVGFRCIGTDAMRYRMSLADFDDTDGHFIPWFIPALGFFFRDQGAVHVVYG